MNNPVKGVLKHVFPACLVAAVLVATAEAGRYVDTLTGMSGMISYWNLNETSGTTAADQVSGLDGYNTGTYSGSGITLGTAGMRPDNGFRGFDATNAAPTFSNKQQDILQMLNASAYGDRTDLTMVGWIRLNESRTGTEVHFGGLERMGTGRYLFAAHNDARYSDVRARVRQVDLGGTEMEVMSRFALPDDQKWHLFVMTYAQATTLTLYLDGIVRDSDSFTTNFGLVTPTALVFGHDVDFVNAPTRGLNGQLDELAFFDRALTGAEVGQLWRAAVMPVPGTIATASYRQTSQNLGGLRNYWQFSETSGTTAVDTVGGNDGTYVPVDGSLFTVGLGQEGPGAAGGFVGMPEGNTSVRFVYPDGDNYMRIENGAVVGNPDTGISFANGVSALTMSLWFKNSYDGEGYIAGYERSGESDRYVFVMNKRGGATVNFYALADNGVQLSSGDITIDSAGEYAWHHLVQVWDGAEKRLRAYVDGFEVYNAVDEAMTANLFVPEGFFVGRDQLAGIRALGGFVDEMALFDRALSADEVLELYDSAFFSGTLVPGDATRDGKVDAADAQRLAQNWGQDDATWDMGDFNKDGVVNAADASILAANWAPGTGEEAAGVPEPGTIVLLAGALVAWFVHRGQRR